MKINKKQILLFATILGIGTTDVSMKLCREKSVEFSKKSESYIESFTEDDFLIAAHRGFSSLEVENTIPAIELAASKPYIDYIEIDARLSADQKIVLSHNPEFNLYPQMNISISDYNQEQLCHNTFSYSNNSFFVELQTIFNGTDGEMVRERTSSLDGRNYRIPTLLEGIDACQEKQIFLDLKFDKNAKEFVAELQKELQGIPTDHITFQSSDLISLLYLKDICPEYNCLAIIHKEEQLDYIPLFDNLGIRKNLVDEELVQEAIMEGKNVSVWTVNHPEELNTVVEQLGDSYSDVIYISDYPDMIASYLHDISNKTKKITTR